MLSNNNKLCSLPPVRQIKTSHWTCHQTWCRAWPRPWTKPRDKVPRYFGSSSTQKWTRKSASSRRITLAARSNMTTCLRIRIGLRMCGLWLIRRQSCGIRLTRQHLAICSKIISRRRGTSLWWVRGYRRRYIEKDNSLLCWTPRWQPIPLPSKSW